MVVWVPTASQLGQEDMGSISRMVPFIKSMKLTVYATLQVEQEQVMMMQEKPRTLLIEQIFSIVLAKGFRSARS